MFTSAFVFWSGYRFLAPLPVCQKPAGSRSYRYEGLGSSANSPEKESMQELAPALRGLRLLPDLNFSFIK